MRAIEARSSLPAAAMTEPHASKKGRTAAAQAGEHEEGAPPRGQARVVGQQAWFGRGRQRHSLTGARLKV